MPMSLEQHALLKLMEECNEVAQRASKAMQFGAEEKQSDQYSSNQQRLENEVMDLMATLQRLNAQFGYDFAYGVKLAVDMHHKNVEVKRFLSYSQSLGFVEEE